MTCIHFISPWSIPRHNAHQGERQHAFALKVPHCFSFLLALLVYQSANPEYHHKTNSRVQRKDDAVWALNYNYTGLVKLLYHFALITVGIEHHHAFSQLSKMTYLSVPRECGQDQSFFNSA